MLTVHRWYKHLSLFGGEFVVFLSPHLGVGYPNEYPRLPNGNTLDGYRFAFGTLDYIYRRHASEPFVNDLPSVLGIEDELMKATRFTVYPIISPRIFGSVHSDVVESIRQGASHPHASAVIDANDSRKLAEQHWHNLFPSHRELERMRVRSCLERIRQWMTGP
ncbi:hypothetical protein Rcae01_00012 [Novipirellula caenicola]|uniref:Uncharacterized protein n=1 Tax=Novipirellula caenicola TaxID=1536901 RepID=A0ABP9VKB9_9BACT